MLDFDQPCKAGLALSTGVSEWSRTGYLSMEHIRREVPPPAAFRRVAWNSFPDQSVSAGTAVISHDPAVAHPVDESGPE